MIFSRRPQNRNRSRYAKADAAIAEFWQWWPQVRGRVAAAVDTGEWQELQEMLSKRVSAIHADLHWEVGKGLRSQHALIVSPGGSADLRAYAVRWAEAAPPADETFEYHASRQANPDGTGFTMRIDEAELSLDDLRFGFAVDPDRDQADVTVYHPLFPDLPDEVRTQVTFLSLDWLLGEDAVERWVGQVDIGGVPPADAQPGAQLKASIDRLASEEKDDVWALMSGEADGWPVLATAQQPLVPVRFPRFDTHLAVTLPYRSANDGGLPVESSLEALRAKEDELTDLVEGAGTLLAHETTRGVRVLHYYVDSTTDVAERVKGQVGDWAEGKTVVRETYDPGLRNVRHLSA